MRHKQGYFVHVIHRNGSPVPVAFRIRGCPCGMVQTGAAAREQPAVATRLQPPA